MAEKQTISETELVLGLQAKNQEVFSLLYDNYSPALLGIIFTIVKNREDAENLLQDSFVKIWRNVHSYNPQKGRLFTWMVTICRNTAISHLRTLGKKPMLEIQKAEAEVYTDGAAAIGDDGLKKLVFKLEPVYREVINLLYFFGYTQQEASEILNLPLGTVKTRVRTALQLLRIQCVNE